jgi:hypothetical protein
VTVTDGPFTETNEVVGGYAQFELKSRKRRSHRPVRFMELHKKHWPGWEGETGSSSDVRPGDCGPRGRPEFRPDVPSPNPKPNGDIAMRFMVIVKATKESEAGVLPDEKLLAAMGKYNEELVKAGVMLAGEGLQPSSKGARVKFSGTKRTVIDGPFAETKELIAGFWLWKVNSKEEAIEWLKRCPNPHPGESEIEIRQVFEAEDFGAEYTPELRERDERLRAQMATKT